MSAADCGGQGLYLDFLGMSLDWEHRGDCCPGSTVFVQAVGLVGYQREITAKGSSFMQPGFEPAPWGGETTEVTDPFGDRRRFCGP